jgi:hypothetical protein
MKTNFLSITFGVMVIMYMMAFHSTRDELREQKSINDSLIQKYVVVDSVPKIDESSIPLEDSIK